MSMSLVCKPVPYFTLPTTSFQQKSYKSGKTWSKTELPSLKSVSMSLNELIILCVCANTWLDGTSDGNKPQGTLGSTPVPLWSQGQHPSPVHPPFPAAGLTSPLGAMFQCGQMVVREVLVLGSSPAGVCIAIPLPAGVGTGQSPAGWDNNHHSPGDSLQHGQTQIGYGQRWVWPAQG